VALVCDVIDDFPPKFRAQRQHRSEDFPERSKIVLADPAPQAHQFRRESRLGRIIEGLNYLLGREGGRAVMQFGHDPDHSPLAKGNQDAPTELRR
jgi:hypothetical protein